MYSDLEEKVRMIYATDEIRQRITPIAEKYQLRRIYLFGSYARNEATDGSDIDDNNEKETC